MNISKLYKKEKPDTRSPDIMDDVMDSPEKRKGKRTYNLSLQLEDKETVIAGVLTIGSFLIAFYLLGIIILKAQYMMLPYKVMMEYGFFSVTKGLMSGEIGALFCDLLFSGLIAVYVGKQYVTKSAMIDDREIKRSKSGKYGQNDWLNNDGKLLEKTFAITKVNEPVNMPLCIYKNKAYCIPMEPKFNQFKNMNMAVLGSSGSGKSYGTIEPMLLQRLVHEQSFIVADTKGALYLDYAATCEEFGYDVKVFNTKAIHNSNAWNCLQSIVNADEGNVYDLINTFAQVFIDNTSDPRGGAVYWDNNEKDLLKLLLHYVCRSTDFEGKRTFDQIIDVISEGEAALSKRLSKLEALGSSNRKNESTLAYAKTFASKPANLRENYVSGLINKLQVFRTPLVAAALSADDIDFEEAVHKKTAIFLVTSDSDSSYDVVTALFVTSAYLKLIEISDSRQYAGKLKIPFWLILDELCNMAAISDLSKKMATNRSRNICIAFAIQSLGQLEERYGKLWETIISNCGTLIYLGCNDLTTAKYISTRAGKFTQITTTTMTEKPNVMSKFYLPLHRRESVREEPAELVPEAEAIKYGEGNVLVFVAGRNVLKGKSYAVENHPLYAYKKQTSLYDKRPDWLMKYANGDESKIPNDDLYIPTARETEYDIKKTGFKPQPQLKRIPAPKPEYPDIAEEVEPEETKGASYLKSKIIPVTEVPDVKPFVGNTEDLSEEKDDFMMEAFIMEAESERRSEMGFDTESSYTMENPHDVAMEMAINCDGDGDYTDNIYTAYDDDNLF